jgi:signal transduction histidine kinase/CheY-like chemotaxis protein
MAVTAIFVVVSQVKINVTNAYAGSLAWSNFFARLTHSHPGRVVWLVFNVLIAVLLMTLGVFQALEKVLGLYSNVGIAWVGALVADLVINKPLGLSPKGIEFRRAHLYDINPVGLGATLAAVILSVAAYFGAFGAAAEAFSPFIALFTSLALSPLLAWATRGRWYVAREAPPVAPPGRAVRCVVCENAFEAEDMTGCPAYAGAICSLCCTLESRCHDRCKTGSRAAEQAQGLFTRLLPAALAAQVNPRVGHYVIVLLSLCTLLAAVMGVVYSQEVDTTADPGALGAAFVKLFAMLLLVAAVCSWWVVLASESRRRAQEESDRQNRLLEREIEAHGRTDAALQAAKELAESANQAKTRYVAGMTHELRTPLNSILGYAQILLKDDAMAPPAREALQTIHRSGEHLAGLVDGLLDLARIEAGRLRLETAPLALPQFLDNVVRMVRPQAEAKGLEFHDIRLGRMPAWVRSDAKRLRQILINLLGNAVQFTDRGRVTLRVDGRSDVMRFDIEDTGIGIAVQDQQRVFLPFERGAAARRRREPGTGLGLTITGLLTSLMGGELTMRSTPGQGSVFTVRLYMPESADPGPEDLPPQPLGARLAEPRTLLVVDDQPVQRQMLAGMLTPLGFVVREAASGTECLEALRDAVPDAILLDITMDDMDGWQTALEVRRSGHAGVPIIMVSANLFDNRPALLAEHRCQAFVGKPILESELLATLQQHVGLRWALPAAAAPLPAPDGETDAGTPAPTWPEEVRDELTRLVRLGHVGGLYRALDRIAAEDPPRARACQRLRALVAQFDLDRLEKELNDGTDRTDH